MDFSGASALSTALNAATAPLGRALRATDGASGNDSHVSVDFGSVLKASLDKVDAAQKHAEQQAVDFETGKGVELHEAMLSMQKSGIAFQTTVQVRNRLVSAYHDIMNMSV